MQEMKEKQIGSLGWEDPPGGGNGKSLEYISLGNLTDRGGWQFMVSQRVEHVLATKQEQLISRSAFYFFFKLYNIVLVLPNIEMNPSQVYPRSPF